MRLYINHLNITQLPTISKAFRTYLQQNEQYTMIYTNQGIYRVKNNQLVQMNPVDSDVVLLSNYYDSFTLIVDQSYFHELNVESIHGDTHHAVEMERHIHKLSKQGRVELVIEYKYDKKIPHDFYFQVSNSTDPNDSLIKQEIIVFLSMLN